MSSQGLVSPYGKVPRSIYPIYAAYDSLDMDQIISRFDMYCGLDFGFPFQAMKGFPAFC